MQEDYLCIQIQIFNRKNNVFLIFYMQKKLYIYKV